MSPIIEIDGKQYVEVLCEASHNGGCNRLWIPPPGTLIREVKQDRGRTSWVEAVPAELVPQDERIKGPVTKTVPIGTRIPDDATDVRTSTLLGMTQYTITRNQDFLGKGGPVEFYMTNKGDRRWYTLSLNIDGALHRHSERALPRELPREGAEAQA